MSTEENKALVGRYVEEFWNQGNEAAAAELIAPEYVAHDPAVPGRTGPEGETRALQVYRVAAPDLHFTVEDLIAEGDRVVVRWASHGTHLGDLLGIPPTGKVAAATGITILRIAGGKLVEMWQDWDRLGLLQQLGAIPRPSRRGHSRPPWGTRLTWAVPIRARCGPARAGAPGGHPALRGRDDALAVEPRRPAGDPRPLGA